MITLRLYVYLDHEGDGCTCVRETQLTLLYATSLYPTLGHPVTNQRYKVNQQKTYKKWRLVKKTTPDYLHISFIIDYFIYTYHIFDICQSRVSEGNTMIQMIGDSLPSYYNIATSTPVHMYPSRLHLT